MLNNFQKRSASLLVLISLLMLWGLTSATAQTTKPKPKIAKTIDKKSSTVDENVDKTQKTPAVQSRIEVVPGGVPPLLTLVVGQVTTIKLTEPPLQIEGDRLGLSISESNENSVNKNVYIIPTKAGIRRNLIIETASGKVEFELQSIGIEDGKSALFTREVEVKKPSENKKLESLELSVNALKEQIAAKDLEIAASTDRIAQAVQTAQKSEYKIQTETLFALARTKKGKTQTSSNKEWTVTEVFAGKTVEGNRSMFIFEIEYRGKTVSKFLDVKSDDGSQIYWQTEKGEKGEGVLLNRGDRVRVAVLNIAPKTSEKSLVFVVENDIVKFN
jgi:hypothetical protein